MPCCLLSSNLLYSSILLISWCMFLEGRMVRESLNFDSWGSPNLKVLATTYSFPPPPLIFHYTTPSIYSHMTEGLPTPHPYGQQCINRLRDLAACYEPCSECLHQLPQIANGAFPQTTKPPNCCRPEVGPEYFTHQTIFLGIK